MNSAQVITKIFQSSCDPAHALMDAITAGLVTEAEVNAALVKRYGHAGAHIGQYVHAELANDHEE